MSAFESRQKVTESARTGFRKFAARGCDRPLWIRPWSDWLSLYYVDVTRMRRAVPIASLYKMVQLADNLNANMQITSIRSLITIFVTVTMMKEYDMDRNLWLIAYFRSRQIDRNCVVPYVFPSIIYTHLFLLNKISKNDSQGGSQVGSQGGSLSARSFDLARPGLAPPLRATVFNWQDPCTLHMGNPGNRAGFMLNNYMGFRFLQKLMTLNRLQQLKPRWPWLKRICSHR